MSRMTSRSNVTLFSKGFRHVDERILVVLQFKRNPVLEGI